MATRRQCCKIFSDRRQLAQCLRTNGSVELADRQGRDDGQVGRLVRIRAQAKWLAIDFIGTCSVSDLGEASALRVPGPRHKNYGMQTSCPAYL